MSILIKGMEMPTCMTCPCCEEKLYGNLCRITNEIVPFSFYRGDKCPLIELPPHGRLIDGDVAEVIPFTVDDEKGDFSDGILYAADWISKMPTIIEAEVE